MRIEQHIAVTTDGWRLVLHRGVVGHDTSSRPPILFVPGYGMNSFIFRYHPSGPSFMRFVLDAGFDPWSIDLRTRSNASKNHRYQAISLADQAFLDLPAAFDLIAEKTGFERITAIGCSLGGALLFGYGGMVKKHRIDRLVAMGAPLRWVRTSPLVGAFGRFAPWFSGVPIRGSRHMARFALPLAVRLTPNLLSIYLNPSITRTRPARELCRTVENPIPELNVQMGEWIRSVDLFLCGQNVTTALRAFDRPLLVVCGNADQICPKESALTALDAVSGPKDSILVGDSEHRFAHADLFISDLAQERVYKPIVRWLREDATQGDPQIALNETGPSH